VKLVREGFQILHELWLLLRRETELTNSGVVRHDIGERGGD
jgi:hypothetical protein